MLILSLAIQVIVLYVLVGKLGEQKLGAIWHRVLGIALLSAIVQFTVVAIFTKHMLGQSVGPLWGYLVAPIPNVLVAIFLVLWCGLRPSAAIKVSIAMTILGLVPVLLLVWMMRFSYAF